MVFGDADLDSAAATLAEAGFFNAGQDCTASTRILEEGSVRDEFLEKITQAAKDTAFGTPDKEDILYGPLNNA
ncbi:aldehyde dehydrogenase family protein, partial [Pseudomonas syringae pv. tagetis]|uniref:aldehyde dehydrogenase family protein n=1 Tax=Pseudomonas syringae group genomosp. 7 TaxID=251699 RepID=UPI00376F97A3